MPDEESPEQEEPQGAPLVTVLYSMARDVYRVPSMGKPVWLSVHRFSDAETPHDDVFYAISVGADEGTWRKAYKDSPVIVPGDHVTLPADDVLVKDYAAIK